VPPECLLRVYNNVDLLCTSRWISGILCRGTPFNALKDFLSLPTIFTFNTGCEPLVICSRICNLIDHFRSSSHNTVIPTS